MTVCAVVLFTVASFNGWFRSWIPVTLQSDRSGLIMEPGGKVKMRGLEVGRVGGVDAATGGASVALEIDPAYVRFIPANVTAETSLLDASSNPRNKLNRRLRYATLAANAPVR